MTPIGVDTSVSIPLLVRTHGAHAAVTEWWRGQELALSGHALPETFSVLTRLPGDLRLSAEDAARLIETRFARPLLVGSKKAGRLPRELARLGVAGGAVYDGLVALAARENGAPLATRDARARATYEKIGVDILVAA